MSCLNIPIFIGPDIDFENRPEEKFIRVGDGESFIQESDVEQQKDSEIAIIYGHGNVREIIDINNHSSKTASIDLIAGKLLTAHNIIYLQEKLKVRHFYLFSCRAGTISPYLYALKNKLMINTTVTIFTGKNISLDCYNTEMIRKISLFYQQHQGLQVAEIDKLFFKENALFASATTVRCEVTENGGEKKFSAFKVRAPKRIEDIDNYQNYIYQERKIKPIILEDFKSYYTWNSLAKCHANVDLEAYRDYALLYSAVLGKIERVMAWIKNGAKFNQVEIPPLTLACERGHVQIAQLLINQGADIHITYTSGHTCLDLAATRGHSECVQMLIDAGCTSSEASEALIWALFPEAAPSAEKQARQLTIVKQLLKANADVNWCSSQEGGHTPLFKACMFGCIDIVRLLIENKAKIDSVDSIGNTALIAACHFGHKGIVEFLIQAGAEISHKTNDEKTAIQVASIRGHGEIVTILQKAGAEL